MSRFPLNAGAILGLAMLLGSCSLLLQLQHQDSILGEHVIVLIDESDVEYEQYLRTTQLADRVYEEVTAAMELPFTATIVLSWGSTEQGVSGSAGSYAVRLNSEYLKRGADELSRALRHEFTHVVARAHFGPQQSLCLSEGLAEYIADQRSRETTGASRQRLEELLRVSYEQWYFLEVIPGFEARDAYDLAADFVIFWCERYGLSSFYDLYAEGTTVNFRSTIATYSGESFEDVHSAFLLW